MKRLGIPQLSKEVFVFLCLSFLSALVLFNYVDLIPRVDSNFFFSSTDPQSQDDNLITREFKRKDDLLIINASGPINSPDYKEKISFLSDSLFVLDDVTDIYSISYANGPMTLRDALAGPLLSRLLITKDLKSTNIIIFLKDNYSDSAIPNIEKIVAQNSGPDFHLTMSGSPYIVWQIGRLLFRDIKFFSLLAVLIFGTVIFLVFRLKEILLGSLISCISASMWTLILIHILGIKIGLLTANIATIVFVLTLSHIVFLTYNWKNICSQGKCPKPVEEAIRLTFSSSFWCMVTAMLGFLSLLRVPAQPLRELGGSGVVGSLIALGVAYGVYPAFLRTIKPSLFKISGIEYYQKKAEAFFEKRKKSIFSCIVVLFIAALPGLWRLNSDPSLLSYFSKNSVIEKGLIYIDKRGGSSPLLIVVKTDSGEDLISDHAYKELGNLQEDLEDDPAVGTVISLPVLIAQAHQTNVLSFLLSRDELLNYLEQPKYGQIAKSFITEDRMQGLFLLRMNESHRTVPRLKIIHNIKKIVYDDGLIPVLVGGIYSLQGHLFQLVKSSVVFGLGQLIFIFSIIAWIVSRSLRTALAITLSISAVPVIVLGAVGWFHVPLDVISAPACNIAVGLGIDSMIHMVRYYRRQKPQNKNSEALWQAVRFRYWQPIITFTFVMVLGFGIIIFSNFPSTQRFGA